MTCTNCGNTMDASARFCSACGQAVAANMGEGPASSVPPPYYVPPHYAPSQLVRPREGRMIAGVCAGFALRFGGDLTLIRLVLVIAAIFGMGTPILAYFIAWIVMPNAQYSLPYATGVAPR